MRMEEDRSHMTSSMRMEEDRSHMMSSMRMEEDRSHMTSSMRMEEDQSHITERILNLTLEIIYLLTGEDCEIVKKFSREPLKHIRFLNESFSNPVAFPNCLTPKTNTNKKLLEVIKKMMELLTGEVPIRCQDVTVYFSMEEWEYLEGHKELYKDVMMASQPSLTSSDGSSNGKLPERCPRPLHSHWDPTQKELTISHQHQSANLRDWKLDDIKEEDKVSTFQTGHKDQDEMMESSSFSNPPEGCPRHLYTHRDPTQEDLSIPHHHQTENIGHYNIIIKEEYKEDDEEYSMMEFSVGHKDLKEPSSKRNLPWRCPLYSHWDPTQEDLTIPHHHQGEDVIIVKVEGEVEDSYEGFEQQHMEEEEEAGMRRTFIEEDTPTHISTGSARLHSVDGPGSPFTSEPPRTVRDGARVQKKFSCPECGEGFNSRQSLSTHQRCHTGEALHSCSECGKCFFHKSDLTIHNSIHTGKQQHFCSECGQYFLSKSRLDLHHRSHTGEKPYPCNQCGKCFADKTKLFRHQKLHTGERPYPCPECGKSFADKTTLIKHQRLHTGEKPYTCPVCAKSYTQKSGLDKHISTHTGEKPFSCPECGKCFAQKFSLSVHQRLHTGEKPYACPQCGKCYAEKARLSRHLKWHTDGKPYACSECGRCFSQKSDLIIHQRSHTGERPYPCNQCGKCFSQKSYLNKHLKTHAAPAVD